MTVERRNGFTLIELSIVLVIIGLIVVGILVGQDMIRQATVRAQISQLQKYNTAVNTFRGKYGYLPGDMPPGPAANFGFYTDVYCGSAANAARNGTGLIADDLNGIAGGEAMLVWLDLSMAGLIDQAFTLAPWTALGPGYSPCSIAALSNVNQMYPSAKLIGNSIGFNSDGSSNWFLVTNSGLFLGTGPDFAISVADAYQIDTKIDDGRPTTGNVLAEFYGSSSWTVTNPILSAATDSGTTLLGTPPCWNSTTKAYATSYLGGTSQACLLSVKLQ